MGCPDTLIAQSLSSLLELQPPTPLIYTFKKEIFLSKKSLVITITASRGTLQSYLHSFSGSHWLLYLPSAGNAQIPIPVQVRPVSASINPQYGRVPHLSSPHCSHHTPTPGCQHQSPTITALEQPLMRTRQRERIGRGRYHAGTLPPIPSKLKQQIRRGEYIRLAQLLNANLTRASLAKASGVHRRGRSSSTLPCATLARR